MDGGHAGCIERNKANEYSTTAAPFFVFFSCLLIPLVAPCVTWWNTSRRLHPFMHQRRATSNDGIQRSPQARIKGPGELVCGVNAPTRSRDRSINIAKSSHRSLRALQARSIFSSFGSQPGVRDADGTPQRGRSGGPFVVNALIRAHLYT